MSETSLTTKPNGHASPSPTFEGLWQRSETAGPATGMPRYHMIESTSALTDVGEPRAADRLYPFPSELSHRLTTALRLLKEATNLGQAALSLELQADHLGADDSFYGIKAILPELFLCRALGDGFGTVIGALLSAFENKKGESFEKSQMRAVVDCIAMLYREPFLRLDSADGGVRRLEEVGLDPDPCGLRDLMKSMVCDE